MERKAFEEHLVKNIIPFWNKLVDKENGGFYGMRERRKIRKKHTGG